MVGLFTTKALDDFNKGAVTSTEKSPHLRIKEFQICDATATTKPEFLHNYLITKNKSSAPLSRTFFLFLYMSFPFSANLRREMTTSQVLQGTWTRSREFEFPFLALTPQRSYLIPERPTTTLNDPQRPQTIHNAPTNSENGSTTNETT